LKFKHIFIIFNIIIVISIALIVFLSFTVLKGELPLAFLGSVWPMIFLLTAVLIILDVCYYNNRHLFYLLEREDWPALVQYLESEVFRKGRYLHHMVRLLANTYLVLSDVRSVMSLENKIAVIKPVLLDKNVLVFAAARLLGGDAAGAVKFLEAWLNTRGKRSRQAGSSWVRLYYGFALLLNRRFPEAADQCMILCTESGDAVVTGLSAYFLSETISAFLPLRKEELYLAFEEGRRRTLRVFPGPTQWNRASFRLRNEIHIVILTDYIKKTGAWLYPRGR
jgi:hypothetical protein